MLGRSRSLAKVIGDFSAALSVSDFFRGGRNARGLGVWDFWLSFMIDYKTLKSPGGRHLDSHLPEDDSYEMCFQRDLERLRHDVEIRSFGGSVCIWTRLDALVGAFLAFAEETEMSETQLDKSHTTFPSQHC